MTWARSLTTWEWVGYLGWCFCGYAAYLFVSTLWRGNRPRHAERWMNFVTRLSGWRWRMRQRGRAHAIPISYAFSIACLILMVTTATGARWPIVEDHNLRIERRVSRNQWWIVDDEHPQGFMYYACSDFENDKWIFAGYYCPRARWRVQNGCNSIRSQGLEFDYAWKSDGQAKTIEEAGYGR